MAEEFLRTGIHKYVARYVSSLGRLDGKRVVDIPAGDGRASALFFEQGAEVLALDLYPEFLRADGPESRYADMSEQLPVEDGWADFVVCQEGIEHVPNQLKVLEELNRILKPGGMLLITTPNLSNMRSRLSWFLFETDMWRRMPPSEVDSIWFTDGESERMYFGHLFLIGVHRLQSMLRISGFESSERLSTKISATSAVMTVLLYPLLACVSLLSFWRYPGKNPHVDAKFMDAIFREHLSLNLSFRTNACKSIFWVQRKARSVAATHENLKGLQREADEVLMPGEKQAGQPAQSKRQPSKIKT
jgi:SAM-dependent methyltransferase